jgi:hypothetical protein
VVNRRLDSVIIRLYDVNSNAEIRFEYEAYYGIQYKVLKPCFHCFEMESHMLGLAFADPDAADTFACRFEALVVNGKAKPRKDKRYSDDAFSSSSSKDSKTLTQRLKGMYSKLTSNRNNDEVILSEVTSVEHVAHIGMDKDGGINWSKIPHSWKTQFKNNGMKKKDFEKNPVLKEKLLTKLDVYNRKKRLAPPRPKSAKPKLRISKKRVKSTPSNNSSSEMSPEKLARFVETFKKMRTKVDDHIIRSAMKKKGIDPALVFGPEKKDVAEEKPKPLPPRRATRGEKPRERPKPRARPSKPAPSRERPKPRPRERPKPRARPSRPVPSRERPIPSPRKKKPTPRERPPKLPPRNQLTTTNDPPPPPPETHSPPPSPQTKDPPISVRAVRSAPAVVLHESSEEEQEEQQKVEQQEEQQQKQATPQNVNLAPFKKMKMIGMPENAIRGRMAAMGVQQEEIDRFFGHKGPQVKASKLTNTSVSMPSLRAVKKSTSSQKKIKKKKKSLKDLLNAKRKQLHSIDLRKLAQEKEEYERSQMDDATMMFKDIFAERRKVLGTDALSSSGEEWSDGDDEDDAFFD